MNKKEGILLIAGSIYIALAIIAYYYSFAFGIVDDAFWFSYVTFFLIGVGLVIKDSKLIASQFNIIFIPYMIWIIDYLYVIITSKPLFHITSYVFQNNMWLSQLITLQHIYTLPLVFFALRTYKVKTNDAWKYSILQISLFYFFIRLLTDPKSNINWVFHSELPINFLIPYPVAWFLLFIVLILVTNLFVVSVFKKNRKKITSS